MNQYRVVLTHQGRKWTGRVFAPNVDAAIREAKSISGFPERSTSETQRMEQSQ